MKLNTESQDYSVGDLVSWQSYTNGAIYEGYVVKVFSVSFVIPSVKVIFFDSADYKERIVSTDDRRLKLLSGAFGKFPESAGLLRWD
jgi:hypothetical protein